MVKTVQKDVLFRISMGIMLVLGALLWAWGSLARDVPDLLSKRDVFIWVWVLTFLAIIVQRLSKKKPIVNAFPILIDPKKLIEMTIVGLVVGLVLTLLFNAMPFSFAYLFSQSEAGKQPEVTIPYEAAILIFVITAVFVEEKFLGVVAPTILRWLVLARKKINFNIAILLAVILSSIIFTFGHISLTEEIAANFLLASFIFSVINRLVSFKYNAIYPAILSHMLTSTLVIGNLYQKSIFVSLIPLIAFIGLFYFFFGRK